MAQESFLHPVGYGQEWSRITGSREIRKIPLEGDVAEPYKDDVSVQKITELERP